MRISSQGSVLCLHKMVSLLDPLPEASQSPLHAVPGPSPPPPAEKREREADGAGSRDVDEFQPWAPPPFKIGDIRTAIPSRCWVKSPWRSASYVVRDALVATALAAVAIRLDDWRAWLVYWFAQGTMFWAFFVLGHDCGHGSFSDSAVLNSVMGHILHSTILVPYHGWRISHRTHHQNHGNVEKDESWHPLTETIYREMDPISRKMRFTAPYLLFAFPVYLFRRSPGKYGSHFHPNSALFHPRDKADVTLSTACCVCMMALFAHLSSAHGHLLMFKLYWVPYVVFVMWLDLVTYLHHHGHHDKLPWYRGKEWSYLRGGLTTVDRDYGWINNIHHDIGTHVIHHLFPQIPHYHLVEATKSAKNVLGKYYREPEKSGPLPLHLIGILLRSLRVDHFVSDEGDVVFYQSNHQLHDCCQEKLK